MHLKILQLLPKFFWYESTLGPLAVTGIQIWLLPDLSGLVTLFDPQQVRGWRPGCYLIYTVW